VLVSVVLSLTPLLEKYPELATAITYDLALTAPLLFLLLSLKSKVAKFKAVPFFVGGIVIASFLLPENGQEHLNYIKNYIFPIVELGVLSFLGYKIYGGVKTFRSNANPNFDFLTLSKISSRELFGESRFASFFSSEITMFYYAFFAWKRKKLQDNEFTNYKENGSLALAGAFLMVIGIETYAFHFLLIQWSSVAAWILTGLSIYSAFSVIAHIKALLFRNCVLTNTELVLKNGLLADITIPLKGISKIEGFSKEMTSDAIQIGNLGIHKESTNHNIAIHFKKSQTIKKMYGFIQECDILLVHIDEKQRFLAKVNANLNKLSN